MSCLIPLRLNPAQIMFRKHSIMVVVYVLRYSGKAESTLKAKSWDIPHLSIMLTLHEHAMGKLDECTIVQHWIGWNSIKINQPIKQAHTYAILFIK